jgi:hypothetical protein
VEHVNEIQWSDDIEPRTSRSNQTHPLTHRRKRAVSTLKEVFEIFPASHENKIEVFRHKIEAKSLFPPKQIFFPVSPAILKEMDREAEWCHWV